MGITAVGISFSPLWQKEWGEMRRGIEDPSLSLPICRVGVEGRILFSAGAGRRQAVLP